MDNSSVYFSWLVTIDGNLEKYTIIISRPHFRTTTNDQAKNILFHYPHIKKSKKRNRKKSKELLDLQNFIRIGLVIIRTRENI